MSNHTYSNSQSSTRFRLIGGEVVPLDGRAYANSRQDGQKTAQRKNITTRGDECNANVSAKETIHEGPENTITGRPAVEHDIEIGRSTFSGDKISEEGSVRQGTKTVIGDNPSWRYPPESDYGVEIGH